MSKDINESSLKYTLFAIIIVLAVSLLISLFCSLIIPVKSNVKPTATVQPIIDHKQRMVDSLLLTVNRLISSINGSKQSIIIQREGFTAEYQNSIQHSPDVCIPTIKIIYRQAFKMDSTSQTVIRKQDSTIMDQSRIFGEMTDITSLLKYQNQQKTDSIASLKEEKKLTKKVNRNERIKNGLEKLGIFILSFGSGYGAGQLKK